MTAFRTPVDIANRALQHCGAQRLGSLGFNEISKRAAETSFAYDKQREAMLQKRIWTFATRRTVIRPLDSNTMRLTPALWGPLTTYFVGSIVSDQQGSLWISNIPNNLNNDPLLTTFWDPYFGPLSVSLFTTTTAYFAGELVYTAAGDGTNRTYLSLQSGNSDVPGTATTYDPTVTYFKNQVVTFSAVAYMSLIDLNLNNEPDLAPLPWSVGTTYAAGNKVGGSDGVIYQSVGSGNIGHNPTLDNGTNWTNTGILNPWTRTFIGGSGSDKWLQIGGKEFPSGVGLATLNIVYPLGSGPYAQTTTRNAFLLPAGYLRKAPQNPKIGPGAVGGPTGIAYDDWLIEGGYLITREVDPIPLRFIANITDVSRMETLFCEGLAALIALAVCTTITQEKGQFQLVAKVYSEWEFQALTFDGIENGYDEMPEDEYITVRL